MNGKETQRGAVWYERNLLELDPNAVREKRDGQDKVLQTEGDSKDEIVICELAVIFNY